MSGPEEAARGMRRPYRDMGERHDYPELPETGPLRVDPDAFFTVLRTMAIIMLAALFLSGVGTALEGCLGYP